MLTPTAASPSACPTEDYAVPAEQFLVALACTGRSWQIKTPQPESPRKWLGIRYHSSTLDGCGWNSRARLPKELNCTETKKLETDIDRYEN